MHKSIDSPRADDVAKRLDERDKRIIFNLKIVQHLLTVQVT